MYSILDHIYDLIHKSAYMGSVGTNIPLIDRIDV